MDQVDRKRKEKLDSWFSDMSEPFNMYSNHSSVVKVSPNGYPKFNHEV